MAKNGFTLAELLIALGILGTLAVFTIPKVLLVQQGQKYNAITKEAIATISEAFLAYQQENGLNPNMKAKEFVPYLNYVRQDVLASTEIDGGYASGTPRTCSTNRPCLFLHNGAALMFEDVSFGGTATTNAVVFFIDPDGQISSSPEGRGLYFALYYNGRITDQGNYLPGTTTSFSSLGAYPTGVPPWFSWD